MDTPGLDGLAAQVLQLFKVSANGIRVPDVLQHRSIHVRSMPILVSEWYRMCRTNQPGELSQTQFPDDIGELRYFMSLIIGKLNEHIATILQSYNVLQKAMIYIELEGMRADEFRASGYESYDMPPGVHQEACPLTYLRELVNYITTARLIREDGVKIVQTCLST